MPTLPSTGPAASPFTVEARMPQARTPPSAELQAFAKRQRQPVLMQPATTPGAFACDATPIGPAAPL
eukprot:7478374-Alexandrium_andersonii.AAC.1